MGERMQTYGHLVVPQSFGPALGDNRHIHITTRTEIVEHTRPNGTSNEVDSFLALRMSACAHRLIVNRRQLTVMFSLKLLSNTAMAARLPEPIVTYGNLSVEPCAWMVKR